MVIQKNEPAPHTGVLVPENEFKELEKSADELDVYKQKMGNIELSCIRKEECPDSFFSPLTTFLLGVVAGGIGAVLLSTHH